MGVKKWIMKQQWRVVQIRGIWSLFYGVLLLAITYYEYVPFISTIETYGPFIFSGVILFVFLILGYIYDRVLVMWAPSQEVNLERNPYQYVPSPKDHVYWFPIYSALLDASEELAKHFNLDQSTVKETREYYDKIEKLRPERNEDMDIGIELRDEYIKNHEFSRIVDDDDMSSYGRNV